MACSLRRFVHASQAVRQRQETNRPVAQTQVKARGGFLHYEIHYRIPYCCAAFTAGFS